MMRRLRKALIIARKDIRLYFFKAPNITFGLFFPVIMFISFAIGRVLDLEFALTGLVAMSIFFGAGAIQSVALPLERKTGTFNKLVTAPISMEMILLGKTLAGFFFGLVIGGTYTIVSILLTGSPPIHPSLFIIGIILSSFMFSAFGLLLAAPFRDIPQAMPPATLLRVVIVFFSGVFIPFESMPPFLQYMALLSPLTYTVNFLTQASTGPFNLLTLIIDMSVILGLSILLMLITKYILERKDE